MKKIVLSLAGVLAATAFAPEAAAVPSFARQTGMACNSCHFQSYPALTSFGRAFKNGGYTMIGAQAKVEGDHGLSLPATLNASLYTQLRYNKTNGTQAANTATAGSKNSGRFDMPDEMALFVAGRASENIGFMAEIATGAATSVANFKMPFVWDAGTVKISAIPFWSNLGAAGAYDLFGTGSNAAGRVTENGQGYSAAMYMGATNNAGEVAGHATGVALVVSNETFHVDLTPYAATSPTAVAGAAGLAPANLKPGQTAKIGATYLRVGFTPSWNNWDLGIGLQNWSGRPLKGTSANSVEAKLYVIDAQAQGEVAGMPLGIYTSYGSAQGTSAASLAAAIATNGTGVNIYNAAPLRKTSFGILGDLWVLPGTLGLQLGFMRAETGNYLGGLAANGKEKDNSYTLGARYKIRQNVKAGIAYTKFSGNAYDNGGGGGTNAGDTQTVMPIGTMGTNGANAAGRGNSRLTVILSAGF